MTSRENDLYNPRTMIHDCLRHIHDCLRHIYDYLRHIHACLRSTTVYDMSTTVYSLRLFTTCPRLFTITYDITRIRIQCRLFTLTTIMSFHLQTNGFFSVVSSVCIVMTLCCISLDRYMAVTRPTRYKTIVTTRRAGYALLVVWAQAFLYASLPLFGWSKYEYNPGTLHCSPALADKCTLYVFLAFVGFFIPVLIMIVTYVRIFVVIRKLGRKVSTTRRPNTMPSVTAGLSGIVPLTSAAPVTRESKSRLGEKILTPKNTVSQDGYTSLSLTAELSCDPTAGSPETVLANTATITTTIDKELPKLSIAEPSSSHSSNEPASTSGQRSKSRSRRITLMLRRRRAERQLPKEYKVAKIGLLLLVIFLVLWTPYLIVHSCSGNFYAPQTLFRLAMWLVYMNGVANPIVYALLNSNVKQKFKALVVNVCAACCCRRRGNRTR